MKYFVTALTDVGIKKDTNQDSLCVKKAETPFGEVVLAMVCDGMGGLSKGELASATVIRAFASWYENVLPAQIEKFEWEVVKDEWDRLIKELNYAIAEYSRPFNIKAGTTLTAMLFFGDAYLIAHVGDTRVYNIFSGKLEQLTEDQSVVGREIRLGNMTEEQARIDPRRNVLLQCIGASRTVIPEFSFGTVTPGSVYLICSDGFRHEITEQEISRLLNFDALADETITKKNIRDLIEMNKIRRETDNISAMTIKAVSEGH